MSRKLGVRNERVIDTPSSSAAEVNPSYITTEVHALGQSGFGKGTIPETPQNSAITEYNLVFAHDPPPKGYQGERKRRRANASRRVASDDCAHVFSDWKDIDLTGADGEQVMEEHSVRFLGTSHDGVVNGEAALENRAASGRLSTVIAGLVQVNAVIMGNTLPKIGDFLEYVPADSGIRFTDETVRGNATGPVPPIIRVYKESKDDGVRHTMDGPRLALGAGRSTLPAPGGSRPLSETDGLTFSSRRPRPAVDMKHVAMCNLAMQVERTARKRLEGGTITDDYEFQENTICAALAWSRLYSDDPVQTFDGQRKEQLAKFKDFVQTYSGQGERGVDAFEDVLNYMGIDLDNGDMDPKADAFRRRGMFNPFVRLPVQPGVENGTAVLNGYPDLDTFHNYALAIIDDTFFARCPIPTDAPLYLRVAIQLAPERLEKAARAADTAEKTQRLENAGRPYAGMMYGLDHDREWSDPIPIYFRGDEDAWMFTETRLSGLSSREDAEGAMATLLAKVKEQTPSDFQVTIGASAETIKEKLEPLCTMCANRVEDSAYYNSKAAGHALFGDKWRTLTPEDQKAFEREFLQDFDGFDIRLVLDVMKHMAGNDGVYYFDHPWTRSHVLQWRDSAPVNIPEHLWFAEVELAITTKSYLGSRYYAKGRDKPQIPVDGDDARNTYTIVERIVNPELKDAIKHLTTGDATSPRKRTTEDAFHSDDDEGATHGMRAASGATSNPRGPRLTPPGSGATTFKSAPLKDVNDRLEEIPCDKNRIIGRYYGQLDTGPNRARFQMTLPTSPYFLMS